VRTAAAPPLLAPPTPLRPVADTEPAPGPRGRRIASFVGFGVVCVVTLAAAAWLTMAVVSAPPPARPVAVPDLSGMTLDQARQVLSGKNLLVGTVTEQDSTQDQTGRIVEQRPSGRTEVGDRTPVNLVVGRGVSAVAVPDLIGLTPDRARQALSAAGLAYGEQRQPSSDADRGKVMAQTPAAHEQSPPGGTVAVTVGTGMAMVAVPDGIIGVGVDDATAILAGAGLTAVGVEQDGTAASGIVIGSDYAPGQRVPEGSPITLNYSNNALMVMPNLTGRGRDAAAELLQDQGWAGDAGTITVTTAPAASPNLVGAVVSQQPTAGALVRKLGTPVSVGVGVPQITMPALVGKTRGEAERLLRAAGATGVTFADGGTAPRGQSGRVAAQSVPGGAAIAADTTVVVTVFRG
jgi:serine/threonine-protein kinase